MISVLYAADRGNTLLDWLNSYHTFSFGDYRNPEQMGFRTLRVINEDTVKPGKGFAKHQHKDMEILSYVLSGKLEHEDSLGTKTVINAGELQIMSAGTGIRHSEYNASQTEPVHFLQIWIVPNKIGLTPRHAQISLLNDALKPGKLHKIADQYGKEGPLLVHQDVVLYLLNFDDDHKTLKHDIMPSRHVWIQVTRGSVHLNKISLQQGDGAAISDETHILLQGAPGAELLLFDLA